MTTAQREPGVITGHDQMTTGFVVPEPNFGDSDYQGIKTIDDFDSGQNQFVGLDIFEFSFDGHREPTFFDDLYFRIHFTPGQINLGNVLSVQTEEIRVWNAFLSNSTITDYLEPVAQGVSVTAPVSVPYTFTALDEISYLVTVSTDGPPQFSEEITWVINGRNYSVPVTGQRVVVWPFGPNWDQPLTESLEWKTDVFTSFNDTETRRSLRTKPRRKINYRLTLEGNELNQFQNVLFGWQDRQYALPIWQDKHVLTTPALKNTTGIPVSTTGRSFFEGGLAILMTDTYTFEAFEVASITPENIAAAKPLENDWPVNARLYPVNLTKLPSSVATQRLTSKVMTSNVEFSCDPVETDPYIPTLPVAETLDGVEVIYKKPNWSNPLQYDMDSEYDLLDYETGASQQIQRPGPPRQNRRVQWLMKNRQELTEFRALLGRLKGQKNAVYVPTWFSDFEVVEPTGVGSSGLRVRRSQYDTLVGVQPTQNAVLIRLTDGSRFLRKIIGTTRSSGDIEQLSLDTDFPVEIGPQNIMQVSLVHLCRLRQDGVTINYQSDSVSTVEINLTTVKQ